MPKSGARATAKLRRNLRKLLHEQLDSVLNGDTLEDGVTMSVMDSMVLRALQGFGFNVRVHALHPNDPAITAQAPETVAPGPAVGLVRDA